VLVVNFDCVSDGDYMLMTFAKDAAKDARVSELKNRANDIFAEYGKTPLIEKPNGAFYPSDQVNFKSGMAVASLNKNKLVGYYADKIHTKADTVFDETNITSLVNLYSEWCLENL